MTRVQCAKCPWKVSTDPNEIPNGYSVEKHRALKNTIAEEGDLTTALRVRAGDAPMRFMACHETHDTPCVGWLAHQLGEGNNLALRLLVFSGAVDADVRTIGEQHERFEDTLPTEPAKPRRRGRPPRPADPTRPRKPSRPSNTLPRCTVPRRLGPDAYVVDDLVVVALADRDPYQARVLKQTSQHLRIRSTRDGAEVVLSTLDVKLFVRPVRP